MNKFFNTCRRCLNPWMFGAIAVVIIGLIIFAPIVGITAFIAALPLIGCTVMCGTMAFFMGKKK
mgnify:CR=1 FL=1